MRFPKLSLSRTMYRVRYWHEKHQRVQTWYSSKVCVLVGNDLACDLKLDELDEGEVFRIDFQAEKISSLSESMNIPAAEETLVSLGQLALVWTKIDLLPIRKVKPSHVAYTIVLVSLLFTGLLYSQSENETEEACDRLSIRVASGRWTPLKVLSDKENAVLDQIEQRRRIFKKSVRSSSLVAARSELSELRAMLVGSGLRPGCGVEIYFSKLEGELAEKQVLLDLKNEDYVEASHAIRNFSHALQPGIRNLLTERVLSKARLMVQKRWILENENPEAAYQLGRKVHQICSALGREEACLDSTDQTK